MNDAAGHSARTSLLASRPRRVQRGVPALFTALALSLAACSGQSGAQISEPGTDQSSTDPAASTATEDAGAPHKDASSPPTDNGNSGDPGDRDAGTTPSPDAGPQPLPAPDPDTLPWATGTTVGAGVASKDTQNPNASGVLIAYGAYGITLAGAEAWATALYRASLQQHGVRYIYAVQGPSDPQYSQAEIGNTKIIAALLPQLTGKNNTVVVAAHAAGTLVAHELLGELGGGWDPKSVALHRVVYFNLDGSGEGLSSSTISYLKRAYFVGAHSTVTGTSSTNASSMQSLGMTYANAGGYVELDASASGCVTGGLGCMHMTPITTRPHDTANADLGKDYSDFMGRPVCHGYIEAKAAEAGL